MDYKNLTSKDIEKLKGEIEHFYNARKLFLGIGWSLIVTAILIIFIGVSSFNDEKALSITITITSLLFSAGIVMFILRSALFNARINNRKQLIKKAMQYQQEKQLFEQNEKNSN